MKIHVTREDIDLGERGSCLSCPIALAVKRQADIASVRVEVASIRVGSAKAILPDEARRFVDHFDYGRDVHPFSFDLPIDDALAQARRDTANALADAINAPQPTDAQLACASIEAVVAAHAATDDDDPGLADPILSLIELPTAEGGGA